MVNQNIGHHFYFQNICLIFFIVIIFLNIPQVKSMKDFSFLDLLHPEVIADCVQQLCIF